MEIQNPQTRGESHVETPDKGLLFRGKVRIVQHRNRRFVLDVFCPESSSTEWLLATLPSSLAATCSTVLACGLPSMLKMVLLLLKEG
jgi:hypothetical protein